MKGPIALEQRFNSLCQQHWSKSIDGELLRECFACQLGQPFLRLKARTMQPPTAVEHQTKGLVELFEGRCQTLQIDIGFQIELHLVPGSPLAPCCDEGQVGKALLKAF